MAERITGCDLGPAEGADGEDTAELACSQGMMISDRVCVKDCDKYRSFGTHFHDAQNEQGF